MLGNYILYIFSVQSYGVVWHGHHQVQRSYENNIKDKR